MSYDYRVVVDGKTVWSGTSKEYSSQVFPPEWRGRPEAGEVHLYIDDELIGVQRPPDEDETRAFFGGGS